MALRPQPLAPPPPPLPAGYSLFSIDVHTEKARSHSHGHGHSHKKMRPAMASAKTDDTVQARLERLSALHVFPSKLLLYGAFVWAHRVLHRPKRRRQRQPASRWLFLQLATIETQGQHPGRCVRRTPHETFFAVLLSGGVARLPPYTCGLGRILWARCWS